MVRASREHVELEDRPHVKPRRIARSMWRRRQSVDEGSALLIDKRGQSAGDIVHLRTSGRHTGCNGPCMQRFALTLASLLLLSHHAHAESPERTCGWSFSALGAARVPANAPGLPLLRFGNDGSSPTVTLSHDLERDQLLSGTVPAYEGDTSGSLWFALLPALSEGGTYSAELRGCGGTLVETSGSWNAVPASPLPTRTGILRLAANASATLPVIELQPDAALVPFAPVVGVLWRVRGELIGATVGIVGSPARSDRGGVARVACAGGDESQVRRSVTVSAEGWLSPTQPLEAATLDVEVDCTEQFSPPEAAEESCATSRSPASACLGLVAFLLLRRRSGVTRA